MPRAGFEPTIPMFERSKTIRALDSAAIWTGEIRYTIHFMNFVCLIQLSGTPNLLMQWVSNKTTGA